MRRRLHAVDAEGRLFVGADCAVEVWLRTPGDAWLGRLAGLPIARQIARFRLRPLRRCPLRLEPAQRPLVGPNGSERLPAGAIRS